MFKVHEERGVESGQALPAIATATATKLDVFSVNHLQKSDR